MILRFAAILVLWSVTLSCKRAAEMQAISRPENADSVRMAFDWYMRAASLYEEGIHLDSALALSDSALRFRPDDPNIWHLRGNLLGGHKSDFIGARTAYNEAIRLKPDYAWAWWHRGCLHASTGLSDSALVDLRHAIAIDSSFKSGPASDDCWKRMREDPRLMALTK